MYVNQVHAPKENVESKHGKHDGEVSDHTYSITELVNEEEPLIHHPVDVNQKNVFYYSSTQETQLQEALHTVHLIREALNNLFSKPCDFLSCNTKEANYT